MKVIDFGSLEMKTSISLISRIAGKGFRGIGISDPCVP